MSDRANNKPNGRATAILLALTVLAGWQPGCSTDWRGPRESEVQTPPTPEKPAEKPVGESRKFQQARDVAPEDIEAFHSAVDQISRLDYGPAESEIRVLLVRFESVDDPKYVSEALFWLGYCCEKQGVTEQARDYYQRVVEHYADTPPGKQATQRLKLLPPE